MPSTGLTFTIHDTATDFRDRAEAFLLTQEATNSLMLGLTSGLVANPAMFGTPPFFATVEDNGAVVAAALRTPPYNLILSATDAPKAFDLTAARLAGTGVELPGVVGPRPHSGRFAGFWSQRTGVRADQTRSLRNFEARHIVPPAGVPGQLRPVTIADRDLLVRWILAFGAEANTTADTERMAQTLDIRLADTESGFAFWEVDGTPVAFIGYTGPTPNGIRIGPVYTPPALRRRGYGSAVTAALSQQLLDAGRRCCFLSTDQDNHTAAHIYQAMGYQYVSDVDEFTFHRAP